MGEKQIKRIEESQQEEVKELLEKYTPLLHKFTKRALVKCPRLEFEDTLQILRIALINGYLNYDKDSSAKEISYYYTILLNAVNSICREYYSDNEMMNGHSWLNMKMDYSEEFQNNCISYTNEFNDANEMINFNETMQAIGEVIKTLSPLEKRVMGYYLRGYSIPIIAKKIKKTPKTVYNVIHSFRDKICKKIAKND